eukprot:363878-Chlamydomonas_euryale.AAC.2
MQYSKSAPAPARPTGSQCDERHATRWVTMEHGQTSNAKRQTSNVKRQTSPSFGWDTQTPRG